jgi:DNA helicase-2/ATP-dependent DNA helicase PcrA
MGAILAAKGMEPADAVRFIVGAIDFLEHFDTRKLGTEKRAYGYNVSDDVQVLIARASDFTDIETFVDNIIEFGDRAASEEVNAQGRAVLSTIHRIKGLEYRHVYLMSAVEGVIPFKKAIMEESLLDEERRLFYVALTRAMDGLTLVTYKEEMDYAHQMYVPATPSRFLREAEIKS